MIKDVVKLLVPQLSALNDGTVVADMEKKAKLAASEIQKHRAHEGGLFQGMFNYRPVIPGVIHDLEDHVDRCVHCGWEIEYEDAEYCEQCGMEIVDPDDYEPYEYYDRDRPRQPAPLGPRPIRNNQTFGSLSGWETGEASEATDADQSNASEYGRDLELDPRELEYGGELDEDLEEYDEDDAGSLDEFIDDDEEVDRDDVDEDDNTEGGVAFDQPDSQRANSEDELTSDASLPSEDVAASEGLVSEGTGESAYEDSVGSMPPVSAHQRSSMYSSMFSSSPMPPPRRGSSSRCRTRDSDFSIYEDPNSDSQSSTVKDVPRSVLSSAVDAVELSSSAMIIMNKRQEPPRLHSNTWVNHTSVAQRTKES